jgi:hypothetical protein
VGPAIVAACELPQSARGGPSTGACCGDGGGVGARAAVGGIGRSEREGERDEERVGDADATVHDKLKRGSWDGYKMNKI